MARYRTQIFPSVGLIALIARIECPPCQARRIAFFDFNPFLSALFLVNSFELPHTTAIARRRASTPAAMAFGGGSGGFTFGSWFRRSLFDPAGGNRYLCVIPCPSGDCQAMPSTGSRVLRPQVRPMPGVGSCGQQGCGCRCGAARRR